MNIENKRAITSNREKIDWFLKALVAVANKTNWEGLPITLNVNGLIISGYLVSGREFFENLFEGQTEDSLPGIKEIIDDLYPDSAGKDEEEQDSLPAYIHLRDARIHHPGQPPIPIDKGVYWRGCLEGVNGFCFGVSGVK
jgi:hypothetical protein